MTVGIPQTNNSSWRIKYDKVEKDALNPKDNTKPSMPEGGFREHETADDKPKNPAPKARLAFGKLPIKKPVKPQGYSATTPKQQINYDKKVPAPSKPRGGKESLGDKVQQLKTPQTTSFSSQGKKLPKSRDTKDLRTDRTQDTRSRTATSETKEQRSKRISDTQAKIRHMREQQGKIDVNRKREEDKRNEPEPKYQKGRVQPKRLKVKPEAVLEQDKGEKQFGKKRGLRNPDKIPVKGNRMIQTKNPKVDTGEKDETKRWQKRDRGIQSTQTGDKTPQQSRMKKPMATAGQTAFRSRTIEDEALGRGKKDFETEKDKRESQSKRDRGVKDDKPKTPKNIKVERPEQAGTEHSFSGVKNLTEEERRRYRDDYNRERLGSEEMQDRKESKTQAGFGGKFAKERVGTKKTPKTITVPSKMDVYEEAERQRKEGQKQLPHKETEGEVKEGEVVTDIGQPAKPRVATARDSKTESSNVQETGGDTGHKEVIPKKPKKTHTGNVGYSHPPTKFERDTGKKDEDGNPIKETTNVPESLVHEKLVGNKRQFVLSGEDKETGITAKEVHDASDGQSTQRSLAEYDKERRSQRSKTPKPKTSPSKGKKGNTSKTPKSITVPSKFDLMGKALIQQAESRLKLIQLKSNL
jgi:hypothetical protein